MYRTQSLSRWSTHLILPYFYTSTFLSDDMPSCTLLRARWWASLNIRSMFVSQHIASEDRVDYREVLSPVSRSCDIAMAFLLMLRFPRSSASWISSGSGASPDFTGQSLAHRGFGKVSVNRFSNIDGTRECNLHNFTFYYQSSGSSHFRSRDILLIFKLLYCVLRDFVPQHVRRHFGFLFRTNVSFKHAERRRPSQSESAEYERYTFSK